MTNMNGTDQSSGSLDENLYSRQLYVLGHEAMKKMQNSNVLISGIGGLGVEIAKNIILAGVKSVTLHDQETVSYEDLSSQYFVNENDIGLNRAVCSQKNLSELNSYVPVFVNTNPLNFEFVKKFQVVVLTENSLDEHLLYGKFCHENNIKFIIAETRGVFGKIFCDFGESFTVFDVNGQNKKTSMISYITNDQEGIATMFEDQRHDLEDGDYVTFKEVKGMTEINDKEFKIRVLNPFSFTIGDTSNLGKYQNGGIAIEVKKEKLISFVNLFV